MPHNRPRIVTIDGMPLFDSSEDRATEQEVAELLEAAWDCKLHSFGLLAPIDFFAVRNDRMVALIEVKGRTHPSHRFTTTWLNVGKYQKMLSYSICMDLPAIFVVKFTDGVFRVTLDEIDARRHAVRECKRINQDGPPSKYLEPVIEIPIAQLRRVKVSDERPEEERPGPVPVPPPTPEPLPPEPPAKKDKDEDAA
jgi:hypothetical protein